MKNLLLVRSLFRPLNWCLGKDLKKWKMLEQALVAARGDEEQTAAFLRVSLCRSKGKVRVEVDAQLDEEVIGRLIDLEKVRELRERRQRQQTDLEALPPDEGYRIKPRRQIATVNPEKERTRVLTKKASTVKDKLKKKGEVVKSGKGATIVSTLRKVSRTEELARPARKSEPALAKLKEADEQKRELPFFAQPFLKLREVRKVEDWTRSSPPRIHGLHMHTKCFARKERERDECEKVPVFERHLGRAAALNGGPLSGHVERRSHLYDSMCQELMALETRHIRRPDTYVPRSAACDDCRRCVGAAEGLFLKSSYQDHTRNTLRRAHQPSQANLY